MQALSVATGPMIPIVASLKPIVFAGRQLCKYERIDNHAVNVINILVMQNDLILVIFFVQGSKLSLHLSGDLFNLTQG